MQITLGSFTYSKTDLSLEMIKTAFSGLYFNPENAATSEQNGHLEFFKKTIETMQKIITPSTESQAVKMLERFKTQYLERVRSYLSTRSGIVSWHIAGRSNYPARGMQKRNEVDQRKTNEFLEWREYRVKRLCSILKRASNPLTRVEQLTQNLEQRTAKQAHMRAINSIIRKHKATDTPALRAALEPHGIEGVQVTHLLTPDFCKRIGYADYELTNNNAQIRRLTTLLAEETKKAEQATLEPRSEKIVNGITIEEDLLENRIRLHYPDKPDALTISKLKSHGWRWSPKNTAWQRILTNDARYNAEHTILKLSEPLPVQPARAGS